MEEAVVDELMAPDVVLTIVVEEKVCAEDDVASQFPSVTLNVIKTFCNIDLVDHRVGPLLLDTDAELVVEDGEFARWLQQW